MRWHCPPDTGFEIQTLHATSRSRSLPTILSFASGWRRNIFVSFKPPRPGNEPRTLAWKAAVLTTTLGPPSGAHRCHFCKKVYRNDHYRVIILATRQRVNENTRRTSDQRQFITLGTSRVHTLNSLCFRWPRFVPVTHTQRTVHVWKNYQFDSELWKT